MDILLLLGLFWFAVVLGTGLFAVTVALAPILMPLTWWKAWRVNRQISARTFLAVTIPLWCGVILVGLSLVGHGSVASLRIGILFWSVFGGYATFREFRQRPLLTVV